MSKKILWKDKPSFLMSLPEIFGTFIVLALGGFVFAVTKTAELNEYIDSNFFIKFLGGIIKDNGEYILYGLLAYLLFRLYNIVKQILSLSYQEYHLTKNTIEVVNNYKDESEVVNLTNIYEIRVESDYYLSIFGYGTILISSVEIPESSLTQEPEEVILKIEGIKNPMKVKDNLIKIIKKVRTIDESKSQPLS